MNGYEGIKAVSLFIMYNCCNTFRYANKSSSFDFIENGNISLGRNDRVSCPLNIIYL